MKLAILDRDGVINEDSDAYIKHPDEWQAVPGSMDAIARLTSAGWRVVVATNQAGLARGLFDASTLNAIHARMRAHVRAAGGHIDAIFFCPHHPDDGCQCRKPRDGMLRAIAHRYDIDLSQVPMAGDSLRDLQAAASAGCQPWLVRTGNGERTLAGGGLPDGTQVVDDLAHAVARWLGDPAPAGSGH